MYYILNDIEDPEFNIPGLIALQPLSLFRAYQLLTLARTVTFVCVSGVCVCVCVRARACGQQILGCKSVKTQWLKTATIYCCSSICSSTGWVVQVSTNE